jgi:hypothetical protein
MGFGQTSLSGVRRGFMPPQLKTKIHYPYILHIVGRIEGTQTDINSDYGKNPPRPMKSNKICFWGKGAWCCKKLNIRASF